MSKVIRVKQTDIENIVNNIVSEQLEDENPITKPKRNVALVKDEQGQFHILDTDTGDILASK